MSAQQTSLKSKPVIAVVLVLLAVVVMVNVSVFAPKSKSGLRPNVRVQSSQPMPIDLGDFRTAASVPSGDLAAWGVVDAPALERDPFGKARATTTAPTKRSTRPRSRTVAAARLECNAVLLGGGRPVALINGKRQWIGDQVGKYMLSAIGATGVKLTDKSGADHFLSVHGVSENTGRARVVTEMTEKNGLERTSLVEHAIGERK